MQILRRAICSSKAETPHTLMPQHQEHFWFQYLMLKDTSTCRLRGAGDQITDRLITGRLLCNTSHSCSIYNKKICTVSFYSFLPKGYPGYKKISDRHEFQNPATRCSFKCSIIQSATGFKPQRKAIRGGIRKDQICLRLDWIRRVHVMGVGEWI